MTKDTLNQHIESIELSGSSKLDLIYPPNLQDKPIPERRWMIDNLVPWNNTTALYGNGGTGKSLLAMQMMTAIALGKPFLGHNVKGGVKLGHRAAQKSTSMSVLKRSNKGANWPLY